MNKVCIVSDSTCDLSQELLDRYKIKVIPLYVGFKDNTYKDGIEIVTEQLYEKVDQLGSLPKTSAPSMGDFYNFFKPMIDDGYDIVYIGISSKLSSTLQSATMAANEFPEGRIEIVDSMNLSTGIGLLVLKAATFSEQGMTARKIKERILEIVPKIKTAFVIDTLDYLHKGGRCSAIANFVSTILKIKPIIHVVDGGMIVGQKPRGSKKGYNLMLNQIYHDQDKLDLEFVMVTHSLADDAATYIKGELANNLNIEHICETKAGCVISSHCGKGTIGILYITK